MIIDLVEIHLKLLLWLWFVKIVVLLYIIERTKTRIWASRKVIFCEVKFLLMQVIGAYLPQFYVNGT